MSKRPAGAAKASFLIEVRVKPRAHVSELVRESTGTWTARIHSPPVDGKANAELIALVAKHFGCARSAVSIKSGASSRLKLVQIVGVQGSVDNTV